MESRQFDFYGVRVEFASTDERVASALEKDFGFFLCRSQPEKIDIELKYVPGSPPHPLPELSSGWISSRCTVFEEYPTGEKWISYYRGRALLHWSPRTERGTLWSEDSDLARELSYLFLHSRVGEWWDRRGLHRLHAAALCRDGRAFLLILPSGGGKTTFALSAMECSELRLLSDDTPVISSKGEVLAFPNRIGCAEEPPANISRNFVRTFLRQEHGMKWLIDTEAFKGRVAPRALPGWILVGSRKLHGPPRISPLGYWSTWKELFRSGVIGLGLPQVVELFLSSHWGDILSKAHILFSRARAMTRLMLRSRNYSFELSENREDNLACFLKFLDTGTSNPKAHVGYP